MIVKVAEFRNGSDYLFRIANVDYHACVSKSELLRWQQIAKRALSEVELMECKRANDYDREQHVKSISAIQNRLTHSETRLLGMK